MQVFPAQELSVQRQVVALSHVLGFIELQFGTPSVISTTRCSRSSLRNWLFAPTSWSAFAVGVPPVGAVLFIAVTKDVASAVKSGAASVVGATSNIDGAPQVLSVGKKTPLCRAFVALPFSSVVITARMVDHLVAQLPGQGLLWPHPAGHEPPDSMGESIEPDLSSTQTTSGIADVAAMPPSAPPTGAPGSHTPPLPQWWSLSQLEQARPDLPQAASAWPVTQLPALLQQPVHVLGVQLSS